MPARGGHNGGSLCHEHGFKIYLALGIAGLALLFIVGILMIGGGIFFSLQDEVHLNVSNSVYASPQDYRLLKYKPISCGYIELTTSQTLYPVNLYLLTVKPPRVRGDNFQFSGSYLLETRKYIYYRYYLIINSTISGSFNESAITLLIFEKKQFENFERNLTYAPLYHKNCTSAINSSSCQFSYDVSRDDEEYYILFYASIHSEYVNITLNVQKYIYSLNDASEIYSHCNASCTLKVPDFYRYRGRTIYTLVTTGNVTSRGWQDKLTYTWNCIDTDSLRVLGYFLDCLGALFIVAILLILAFVAVLRYELEKNPSAERTPLITAKPQTATVHHPYSPPSSPELSLPSDAQVIPLRQLMSNDT